VLYEFSVNNKKGRVNVRSEHSDNSNCVRLFRSDRCDVRSALETFAVWPLNSLIKSLYIGHDRIVIAQVPWELLARFSTSKFYVSETIEDRHVQLQWRTDKKSHTGFRLRRCMNARDTAIFEQYIALSPK